MNYIYLVCGSSGSYEDKRAWNVKAFYSEDKAKEFLKLAEAYAEQYLKRYSNYHIDNNPYDTNAWGEGICYDIEKMEIV